VCIVAAGKCKEEVKCNEVYMYNLLALTMTPTEPKIPFMCYRKKILRGLSPNSYIHVSVSDLYIPRISPHIWLQQNRQTEPGKI